MLFQQFQLDVVIPKGHNYYVHLHAKHRRGCDVEKHGCVGDNWNFAILQLNLAKIVLHKLTSFMDFDLVKMFLKGQMSEYMMLR